MKCLCYSSHVFLSPFDCKLIRLVNHYSRLETVTTCLWDALFSNKGPIRSRPYFVLVSWTGRPIHETKTKYSVVQIGPKSNKISGYLAKVTFVLWTETRASRVSFKQKKQNKTNISTRLTLLNNCKCPWYQPHSPFLHPCPLHWAGIVWQFPSWVGKLLHSLLTGHRRVSGVKIM